MHPLPKAELRRRYREKRRALDAEHIAIASHRICQRIIRRFFDDSAQRIHLFLPIARQKEIELWDLLRHAWGEEAPQRFFVPKVAGDALQNFPLHPDTVLNDSAWGIPEPQHAEEYRENQYDIVIIPLLYADARGNRVGYGKGFYDRFLRGINPDALKIGVNFFPPHETVADAHAGDVALDFLVTPDAVIACARDV